MKETYPSLPFLPYISDNLGCSTSEDEVSETTTYFTILQGTKQPIVPQVLRRLQLTLQSLLRISRRGWEEGAGIDRLTHNV